MAVNGYAITTAGSNLITQAIANGESINFTRVQFGTGVHSATAATGLVDRTSLITPLGNGSLSSPVFSAPNMFLTVQYDNSMNGGLANQVALAEFGIFGTRSGASSTEVLIIYGSMGAAPETLLPYSSTCVMVRKYQIALNFGSVAGLTSNFSAIGGYVVSATAPTDTTKLWIDSAHNNISKIYNGTSWVPTSAVLPVLSSDPSSPEAGQIWVNTSA